MKAFNIDPNYFLKYYASTDPAHGHDHIKEVREFASSLADKYSPEQKEMIDLAAVLHDIGLRKDREMHHVHGGDFIRKSKKLKDLSDEDKKALIHAVVEHRASVGNPETTMAKIISDADRVGGSQAMKRAYEWSKHHYPNMTDRQLVYRSARALEKRFKEGGPSRRTYFPETATRLGEIYDPVIEAYRKKDMDTLMGMIKSSEFAPGLPSRDRYDIIQNNPVNGPARLVDLLNQKNVEIVAVYDPMEKGANMNEVTMKAFNDELQKIAKTLTMSTYDPNNPHVITLQKTYGDKWKDIAWQQAGGVGTPNMVDKNTIPQQQQQEF